jgi:hypothetical protein
MTASKEDMRHWFAAPSSAPSAATHRDTDLLIDRLGGAGALPTTSLGSQPASTPSSTTFAANPAARLVTADRQAHHLDRVARPSTEDRRSEPQRRVGPNPCRVGGGKPPNSQYQSPAACSATQPPVFG